MVGFALRTYAFVMRPLPLRVLTWGTIVAAVSSALWLATLAPLRPAGAGPLDAAATTDLPLPSAPTAAGPRALTSDASGAETLPARQP